MANHLDLLQKLISQIKIIQGGMGVGVSKYSLAKRVSCYGQLGVVSATAPDNLLIRGLQHGDPNGNLREALTKFPNQEIAKRIFDKFYISGGKAPEDRYLLNSFPHFEKIGDSEFTIANKDLEDTLVAGAFVEVYLAKQGHMNPIGANFLNKIGWAQLPTLYGGMLAGLDVALIGAGFPKNIPEILTALVSGEICRMPAPINGKPYQIIFDPRRIAKTKLERPVFLGIIGNHLGVRGLPNADGYVIEGHLAGGHNVPPRSKRISETGESIHGLEDDTNFEMLAFQLKKNGRNQPYWLAGNYATRLAEAISLGASGIQVGTPFEFCTDSGITPQLKRQALIEILGGARAYTSARASPARLPFKELQISGTMSSQEVYAERRRVCNLGFLVEVYEEGNKLLTRCSAEPEEVYVKKGGLLEDTIGRKCLCNNLLATIGLNTPDEKPLVTSGADLTAVKDLVQRHGMEYSAENVIDYILEKART